MSFAERDPIAAFAAPCVATDRVVAIARTMHEATTQYDERQHIRECAGCQAELERSLLDITGEEEAYVPAPDIVRRTVGPQTPRLRSGPFHRRRVAAVLGIAAGVLLTLAAGVIVGASASYASAAELDAHQRLTNTSILASTRRLIAGQLRLAQINYDQVHGAFVKGKATRTSLDAAAAQVDTLERTIEQIEIGLTASRVTPTPRSPLAILPMKSALTALCTPAAASAAPSAQTTTAEPATPAPVVQQSTTPAARTPDRALVAQMAAQHVASVVRGDTASEYIVMVLDASDKYVWSTHGNGNLSIEVGADPRTRQERLAYNRAHVLEFWGTMGAARGPVPDFFRGRAILRDSTGFKHIVIPAIADSVLHPPLKPRGRVNDSLDYFRFARVLEDSGKMGRFHRDSLAQRYIEMLGAARGDGARGGGARGGGAGGGTGSGARGGNPPAGVNTPDNTTPGLVYSNGWSGTLNGSLFNQAPGLQVNGGGESGIIGLNSASVSAAENYMFAPGELAPHALKVMVVHITPGTTWTGR